MSKYLDGCFYEMPMIFTNKEYKDGTVIKSKYKDVSALSQHVYCRLKQYEHMYTGSENTAERLFFEGINNKKNWFYAENAKLAEDCNVSESTIKRCKKELSEYGLIKTCKVFFVDSHGRRSMKWVTGYHLSDGTDAFDT